MFINDIILTDLLGRASLGSVSAVINRPTLGEVARFDREAAFRNLARLIGVLPGLFVMRTFMNAQEQLRLASR